MLTPSVPSRHSFSRAYPCNLILARMFVVLESMAAHRLFNLKSMSVHRLYLCPVVFAYFSKVDICASAVLCMYIFFYWPISCIGPHISLSVIPHAWEIFLEMLTIDNH